MKFLLFLLVCLAVIFILYVGVDLSPLLSQMGNVDPLPAENVSKVCEVAGLFCK